MDALRSKSLALTGMLEALVRARLPQVLDIITPADPQRRGCQLSLRVIGGRERGVRCSNTCAASAYWATGANPT